jgi:hypothetical protein
MICSASRSRRSPDLTARLLSEGASQALSAARNDRKHTPNRSRHADIPRADGRRRAFCVLAGSRAWWWVSPTCGTPPAVPWCLCRRAAGCLTYRQPFADPRGGWLGFAGRMVVVRVRGPECWQGSSTLAGFADLGRGRLRPPTARRGGCVVAGFPRRCGVACRKDIPPRAPLPRPRPTPRGSCISRA